MEKAHLLGRAKGSGRLGDTLGETLTHRHNQLKCIQNSEGITYVLVDFVDELLSVGNSKLRSLISISSNDAVGPISSFNSSERSIIHLLLDRLLHLLLSNSHVVYGTSIISLRSSIGR